MHQQQASRLWTLIRQPIFRCTLLLLFMQRVIKQLVLRKASEKVLTASALWLLICPPVMMCLYTCMDDSLSYRYLQLLNLPAKPTCCYMCMGLRQTPIPCMFSTNTKHKQLNNKPSTHPHSHPCPPHPHTSYTMGTTGVTEWAMHISAYPNTPQERISALALAYLPLAGRLSICGTSTPSGMLAWNPNTVR